MALILVARDAAIDTDIAWWGSDRVVELAGRDDVEKVARQVTKGNDTVVFSSPRRRWLQTINVLRAALEVGTKDLSLCHYQPKVRIDIRMRVEATDERRVICPLIGSFEKGGASKAHAVKRAVKDGIADIVAAEMRALAEQVRRQHADLAARGLI